MVALESEKVLLERLLRQPRFPEWKAQPLEALASRLLRLQIQPWRQILTVLLLQPEQQPPLELLHRLECQQV
jgi:hypothetical protein